MKLVNFRGDITDNSAKKEALVPGPFGSGWRSRASIYGQAGSEIQGRFSHGNPVHAQAMTHGELQAGITDMHMKNC